MMMTDANDDDDRQNDESNDENDSSGDGDDLSTETYLRSRCVALDAPIEKFDGFPVFALILLELITEIDGSHRIARIRF